MAAVDHVPSCVARALTAIMNTFRDGVLLFTRLLHRHGWRRLVLFVAVGRRWVDCLRGGMLSADCLNTSG